MAVETYEDRKAFFETEDFAVTATWRRARGGFVEVDGIFDNEHLAADVDAGVGAVVNVDTTQPRFECQAADVEGIEHGDRVEVNGTAYKVRGIEPDGTGAVVLMLSES